MQLTSLPLDLKMRVSEEIIDPECEHKGEKLG